MRTMKGIAFATEMACADKDHAADVGPKEVEARPTASVGVKTA
jgi:hypothetical protein